MNAGCFGSSISDKLISCTIINRNGHIKKLPKESLKFDYRFSSIPKDSIVIEAEFKAITKNTIWNNVESKFLLFEGSILNPAFL